MKINNNRDYESIQAEFYGSTISNDTCDNNTMNYGYNVMPNCCQPKMMGEALPGVVCPPIYECPKETVCHRYICHEVPHIEPCNTRIINHHIYRHTYTPTYSCCEENEVQNVYERRCC